MEDDLPAYVILYGPRAFLGLAGISTILAGTWKAENRFDELGVKAFENANAAGLEPVAYFDDVSDINKEELDAACPTPWLIMVGFAILGWANLIPHRNGLLSFGMEFSLPGMIGFVCCLCIGFVLVWPVREAYNERDFKTMVQSYQVASAFGVVLTGAVIAANMEGPVLPALLFGPILSYALYRFWKNRKMGESWMRNGRPNWNFVVCNGGGNLFVLGCFLFWLSFSAIPLEDEDMLYSAHIPIYISLRSACAFTACLIIVGLTVVTEQVTDEYEDLEEGLGAIGRIFGRFSELFISLGFLLGFALYGMSSFFPSESTIRMVFDALLTIVCIMQGRAYGLLFQKAIPSQDANRWSRLGRIILIVFGLQVVFQTFTGFTSAVFTVVGIGFIIWGHKNIMDDRKKGKLFLDTGKPNASPLVYSFGPVYTSLGWIFLAIAMAIPQPVIW